MVATKLDKNSFVEKTIMKDYKSGLILGVNEQGFLTSYGNKREHVNRIVSNKRTTGILAENKFYDLVQMKAHKTGSSYQLVDSNKVEYATKQLLLAGGNSIEELRSEIKESNAIVFRLAEFFSFKAELVNLNKIQVTYGKVTKIPIFHSIDVMYKGLNLNMTGHQISLMTEYGIVKIHDTTKDVTPDSLSKLLSGLFNTSKVEISQLVEAITK